MVDSSNMALTKSLRLTLDSKHDLTTLLDDNFGYKGSFAYSENRPYAPSPLLTITGIGPISLPLSEIDAKRIIACATQAPFSLGTSTVIDKKNPTWDSFLQSNTANICSGLGLPGGYDIQYKLHKLLLYETGSHTHKEDGMFATMIIVLPSQYTGGEIVVSHDSTSEVIDVSASCTSISVLPWYTDVMHEVKPIRSGYRLVLSYNLMRRSSSRPEVMPTRGNASELSRLHQILERWRTGGYTDTSGYMRFPQNDMVAYVPENQYSESDLDMGQDVLKGKVNQISWVAEMLGFELWLAKFGLYSVWDVDDDSDSEENWIPDRRNQSDCTLEYFTDFDGLINEDDNQLPDPDKREFQPSSFSKGTEPSTISGHYHRAALVVFNKEDMDWVIITLSGVKYGLDKLQTSLKRDKPTPEDNPSLSPGT
ncbi:hypothetical protein JOM56_015505 [Amanita muscaria]